MIFSGMELRSWVHKHQYEIYKLLGATLLCFLWLVIFSKDVGNPNSMIQQEYLPLEQVEEKIENNSDKELEEIENNLEHFSPKGFWNLDFSQLSFAETCPNYPQLCEKIIYSGTISIADQNLTFQNHLEIYSFLQSSLSKGKSLKEVFKHLIINNALGNRRWGATWEKITINLASFADLSEFYKVLVHEFGHIVDLGSLQGKSRAKNGNFTEFGRTVFEIDDPSLEFYRYSRWTEDIRQEKAKKEDFCSGYGMSNPFEDFAECFNLYLTNNQLFQEIGKDNPVLNKKYNFLANLFLGKYLSQGKQELYYQGWRPWDTTKI